MANASLAKPKTVAGSVIDESSLIGLVTGNDTFLIKTVEAQFSAFTPTVETTGDGDQFPFFENNCFLYMNFQLRGFMVADGAIGLSNLVSTVLNPMATNMLFNLATNRRLTFKAIIRQIQINWASTAPHIGIALAGVMHNSDPANLEVAVV